MVNKYAIILVDLVEDFFDNNQLSNNRLLLTKNVNLLIKLGRNKKIPIIWVKQEFKDSLEDAYLGLRKTKIKITIENTPGSRFLKELNILPDDYVIIKKRFSAFYDTNLTTLLKKLKINALIIGGVKTHACIRTTIIDAYQGDFEIIIAKDCIDDTDATHAQISLGYLTKYMASILTNEEVQKVL